MTQCEPAERRKMDTDAIQQSGHQRDGHGQQYKRAMQDLLKTGQIQKVAQIVGSKPVLFQDIGTQPQGLDNGKRQPPEIVVKI